MGVRADGVPARLGGSGGLTGDEWHAAWQRAWADGSWEAGISRVAQGTKNRVDMLIGFGNAVMPQQFYPFMRAIEEVERAKEGTP